jgi:predicted SprT family Zn-dependent metalloprotease
LTLYEAKQLATSTLDEHKRLGYVPQIWKFSLNSGKRLLGKCNYIKKTISLSKHFIPVATPEEIKEITLHEIAHASVGPGHGHGPVWRSMCVRIGAKPERCASFETCKNIPARYTGTCPTCGGSFRAYRRLKSMDRRFCKKKVCKASGRPVIWQTSNQPGGH